MVGIGPGGPLDRTRRAELAIAQSSVVVGYHRYLGLIEDLLADKETVSSGMTREKERCRAAVDKAAAGETVSLISSGDPGVYGMAGLALEIIASDKVKVPVEIVPGITSAAAAAARMGAPLMLDFACISLSDLLVAWDTIETRLRAVAEADLVVALYNPRSKRRTRHLERAVEIFLNCRGPETPVGVGTAVGTDQETIVLSDLGSVLGLEVNMRSIVLVGNSTSRVTDGFFITPRGYQL